MRDLTSLSDKDILAIPPDWPEKLFDNSLESAKAQYRKLAGKWHPDKNPTLGHRVFAHIQVLYAAAEARIGAGTWRINGVLKMRDVRSGVESSLHYRKSRAFELGQMYIGDSVVAWAIDTQYEDLVRNGLEILQRGLHFNDPTMEKEHRKHLPALISTLRGPDRFLVTMKKEKDQLLLRDVLEHVGGKLDPRHVAWIVSRLLNINCYFNFTGVVHNAVSPDTVFISPENHSAAVFGGWWYAARHGQRLLAVPERTIAYGPNDIRNKKTADRRTDSALIRTTGRELLGDISGSRLAMDKKVPLAMCNWLREVGQHEAYSEYDVWYNHVLKEAFGPRRFIRMAINASDIYKEK